MGLETCFKTSKQLELDKLAKQNKKIACKQRDLKWLVLSSREATWCVLQWWLAFQGDCWEAMEHGNLSAL